MLGEGWPDIFNTNNSANLQSHQDQRITYVSLSIAYNVNSHLLDILGTYFGVRAGVYF